MTVSDKVVYEEWEECARYVMGMVGRFSHKYRLHQGVYESIHIHILQYHFVSVLCSEM